MGYTHYFPKNHEPSEDQWRTVKKIAWWVVLNTPRKSRSAGDCYPDERLRGALETIIEQEDASTGVLSGKAVPLNHEIPNIVQAIERKPAIILDGQGELGHETFVLTSAGPEFDEWFSPTMQFCKTARKPYDLLVCSMLVLIDHFVPGWLSIRSDGTPEDWEAALQFARQYESSVMLPKGVDPEQSFKPEVCQVDDFAIEPPSQFVDSTTESGLFF